MHPYCIGQGSPTVVLDAGMGDDWLVWAKTQPQIANFAYVCAYDRAGLSWSDPSPRPRNTRVMAEELHTLSHNAAVPSPYVLAGHSMGGYDVSGKLTSQDPDRVAARPLRQREALSRHFGPGVVLKTNEHLWNCWWLRRNRKCRWDRTLALPQW